MTEPDTSLRDFPPVTDGVTRRFIVKAMAASAAMSAAWPGSAEADEWALPYVTAPEDAGPAKARHYATAVTLAGYAQPVLGKTYAGRPVKLEGNPRHPFTQGATDAFMQAALYGLYDPARSDAPILNGQITSWQAVDTALFQLTRDLDARRGQGFRLLTGRVTSPTLAWQIAGMQERWPDARWHSWEPVAKDGRREAARLVFGEPLQWQYRLQKAAAVISLDDDLLGPGPEQAAHARQWAERRHAFQEGEADSTLLIAEPASSLTGTRAAHRLAIAPDRIAALALALADGGSDGLNDIEAAWLARAREMIRHHGRACLVSIGDQYPAQLQALILAINARNGAIGSTLVLSQPVEAMDGAPEPGDLPALVSDMQAGQVPALLILGANPAHASPAALGFAEALARVPTSSHAGLHADETAALCRWHLPMGHELESWSDARASDGTASIIQPLVRPFRATRSMHEIVAGFLGDRESIDRMLVESTWRHRFGAAFGEQWRESLLAGHVAGSAAAIRTPEPLADIADLRREATQETAGGLQLVVRPCPSVWDGRHADNAWLQETPQPFTKQTWGNAVLLSLSLAQGLDIRRGDRVRIDTAHGYVTGPAWVMPGQAENAISLSLGHGRRGKDRLADGLGYDAYRLLPASGHMLIGDIHVQKLEGREELATTQPHQRMDGHDFVRLHRKGDAPVEEEPARAAPSMFPQRPLENPSWGMSIDLDTCIGCNACMLACVAENNVPVVGPEMVSQGREMHWLRVDHYVEGEGPDARSHFQPVPCMHCEDAPCEMGCPVNATVHSDEGLNVQIYNRCIGTRTCSSYCPYKVRRFNWFDLTGDDPEEIRAMRNPEVTVRDRGVMEKCSYCVQRISAARIEAKKEDRPIRDGEVVTACQQACPTQAIRFGDIATRDSAVSRAKASPRNYTLLKEVNTRPRTTYLARIDEKGLG